jgi:hypothetical protein
LAEPTDDDPGTLVKEHVVRRDVYFRKRICPPRVRIEFDIDLNFWWVELAGRAILKALNTIKLSRLSPELSRGDDHEVHPS